MKLTESHINILRHSLGLDASQVKRSYRNRYVAGQKHHNRIDLMELVMTGFMTKRTGGELFGKSDLFQATYQGALSVIRKGERFVLKISQGTLQATQPWRKEV